MGTAHLIDPSAHLLSHGELGPLALPSGKIEKPVPALLVAGGSQTDGANSALTYIVGVFLMGLGVSAKLDANVSLVIDLTDRQKKTRGVLE